MGMNEDIHRSDESASLLRLRILCGNAIIRPFKQLSTKVRPVNRAAWQSAGVTEGGFGRAGVHKFSYFPSTDQRTEMKTKAAVAWQAGKPLTIEEVELGGPKAGEVLVEIKATGICHTDYYTLSGADPEGIFPAILGHEGAGVVVDVGPGVKSLKKDDHVIPLYTPECRQCKFCLSQKTNLCQSIRSTQGRGLMPDATSRFSIDGKPIFHYMGTSTFSNYIVVPEIALAKIRSDAPFDKACYIGCGVTTGVGAVVFSAKVEAGANVVVFGLGGIGLNVIQAAKMVGADKIIGVDINPAREALARKFGMTHFINPKQTANVVDAIVQLTDGGADYSFECIGNTKVMRQALECTHKGWGHPLLMGVPKLVPKSVPARSSWLLGVNGKALRLAVPVVVPTCQKLLTGIWKASSILMI